MELSFQLNGLAGYDLVINASPVGMGMDNEVPYPMVDLEPTTLVFDVVTEPRRTAWLKTAQEKGCKVVYGKEMVRGQFAMMAMQMGINIPIIPGDSD